MGLPSYKQKFAEAVEGALIRNGFPSPGLDILEGLIASPPSVEKGDLSLPVFKILPAGKGPVPFALHLASSLHPDGVFHRFQAMGPYLNAFIDPSAYHSSILMEAEAAPPLPGKEAPLVIVEYASPNTNKPLHAGHLRNIALAESVIRLLQHEGKRVFRTQIINDRGVHICKSMLAYQKWGNGKTPESEKMKSDHFVGRYYVEFSARAEQDPLLEEEAQAMLVKWEQGNPEIRALWKKMNAWAEKGLFETYDKVGATFDENYYESDIYQKGKEAVRQGMEKGLFTTAENGAVIAPLEKKYGLPDKPLLRGDGTTLYFTQDIYLALQRFTDHPEAERIIYVVGSEQEMHFKQLFAILDLLGYPQGKKCYHLGYGLLTLPTGKMSSRQGTVVNADDLIAELEADARAEYAKRSPELAPAEVDRRSRVVAMAALKFFLVKQDAQKELVFIPHESLSFDGPTGPYLLYTLARMRSIQRKTEQQPQKQKAGLLVTEKEKELIALLSKKNEIIASALRHFSPHVLAHYLLEVANTFNTYYHETKIIQENKELESARLALLHSLDAVLEEGLYLLGIEPLDEM
ncbi:MAG: arginine--tRNA ligase [archaeon]